MKIWVENYNEARLFTPTEATIAVRVFDPSARTHKLDKPQWPEEYPDDFWDNCSEAPFPNDKYLAVFGYTFSDIDMDQPYPEELKKSIRGRSGQNKLTRLFTANMAEDIVKNFSKTYKQARGLLTHCHAGASRSPAIAVALVDIFKLKPEWQGRRAKRLEGRVAGQDYIGNEFVHRLLCEAATRLKLWVD
jgi:hypothetical protein